MDFRCRRVTLKGRGVTVYFQVKRLMAIALQKERNTMDLKDILINSEGVITAITATAANIDERHSLWDLIHDVRGMLIADKGLIGADYQNELRQFAHINLQTATRSNMKETRSEKFVSWLKSTRRLVETVIAQLTERFNIERVRARKRWYLTNRIARKVLAHTVAVFINKQKGNSPLQFELLLKP